MGQVRLFATIAFTLIAFAGNSILCRLALIPSATGVAGQNEAAIDPINFTAIRLTSGALMLLLLVLLTNKSAKVAPVIDEQTVELKDKNSGSWLGALLLFVYAITFSFAYVSLDTGIGALILFGFVQLTMILYSLIKGHRPHVGEWLGLLLAFSGLIYLVAPTVSTPSFIGFVLMSLSGIVWGFYTIAGKHVKSPLIATCSNFVRTLLLVTISLIAYIFVYGASFNVSIYGFVLAALSGSLASGVGYALWYNVVKYIKTTQAAVLQLLVPIIAALGGVVFANEDITLHLIISSLLILGGVLLVLITPRNTKA